MKLNELLGVMRPSTYVKIEAGYMDDKPKEIWCGALKDNPLKGRKAANEAIVSRVDFVPRLIGNVDDGVFAAGYILIVMKCRVRQDVKDLLRIVKGVR